tara:strand:+ start:1488 stop:2780 length:1293 start_codon:yes stop_codon:yes gene_type:complete
MLENKSRILIVDDHPALITLMRHKLVQRGFEVITAQNGEDAFELVKTEYPDLVISDIDMPIMDGYGLCQAIKSHDLHSKIPVILITSLVTSESLMEGIAVGADNYLTKPFDYYTLFLKIDELLTLNAIPFNERKEAEVFIEGKKYEIKADYNHLINLLVSTYKNTLAQNIELETIKQKLNATNNSLKYSKKEYEDLLHNTFPANVAESLLAYGNVTPERYDDVTIMFTDFDGFTKVVPNLSPEELISSLSFYFDKFDEIASEHKLIKIKTIGDSYMAVGGLPERNATHHIDVILAALKIKKFINASKDERPENIPFFPIRIGVHSGNAVVGVIGKKRFAYDIWGNAVNMASRMEQYASDDYINISETTFESVKDFFECESRGQIEIKNMGDTSMYKVKRIVPKFSEDDEGFLPNRLFIQEYNQVMRRVEN